MPFAIDPKQKFIVYGLTEPDTDEIRYIGKSVQGIARVHSHWTESSIKESNAHKNRWIRKLKNQNKKYGYKILFIAPYDLDVNLANKVIYHVEHLIIDLCKDIGFNLTNSIDGGVGSPGRHVSEETRKKMSESAKKRLLPEALKRQWELVKLKPKVPKKPTPSRAIPGAREAFNEKRRYSVELTNATTGQVSVVKGLNIAAKLIGGKCNKTGISFAIKKQSIYYNHTWRLVCQYP